MMTANDQDDSARVAAARSGDAIAFEALVRAHSAAVFTHAMRFFGDAQIAEDVVQEVFVKVYRSLAGFDGTAAFSTWLYRITRNVCIDMLRSGTRRPIPTDLLDVTRPASDDTAESAVTRTMLEASIRGLSPQDRDAISAIGIFGLSYAEAADVLGVPEGTVKSRVFRARRALMIAFGRREGVS